MYEVLVVNASPLIFLGNAGRLELLRAIGVPRVLVPEVVWNEVTAPGHLDQGARSLIDAGWIERVPGTTIPPAIVEWDLGPGESAVLAVSLETRASRPVIDDLAGRRCALALGLDVMGTLGIVISACRVGAIANPREVLLELRASGMWLSDAVIERALRLAGLDR